jgi:hypothetical protein
VREEELEAQRHIIERQNHQVDQTPWLRTTGWLKMFVGYDMEVLAKGYIKPGNEDAAILLEVWNVTIDLIKRCHTGIADCNNRGYQWRSMLKWLKSVEENSHSPSPFSQYIDSNTVEKYSKIWAGLVVLCLRSHREPDKYQVPISLKHTGILREMEQCWEQKEKPDYGFGLDIISEGSWSQESMSDIVLRFSAAVVMFEDWETVGVIPYYCGVLGYNVNSSAWYTADKYTPTLSAVQYCMRVTIFESILPTEKRNEINNESAQTPQQIFQPIRDHWLVDSKPTPFSYVHSLLNYGIAAARGCIGTDNITFSADKTVLNYQGKHLVLTKWEECLHKEIEELERLTRVLLNVNELPQVDFYAHSDSHSNDEKGYYFVDGLTSGRMGSKKWMTNNLEKRGVAGEWLAPDGEKGFWKSKVMSYERDVQEWLRISSVVIPKTCGLSGRGSEMLSVRYCNGRATVRNFLIEDGQMMVYTTYHKSMGLMDQTKVIVD